MDSFSGHPKRFFRIIILAKLLDRMEINTSTLVSYKNLHWCLLDELACRKNALLVLPLNLRAAALEQDPGRCAVVVVVVASLKAARVLRLPLFKFHSFLFEC